MSCASRATTGRAAVISSLPQHVNSQLGPKAQSNLYLKDHLDLLGQPGEWGSQAWIVQWGQRGKASERGRRPGLEGVNEEELSSTGGGLKVRSLVIPPDEVKMRVADGLVGISSLLLLTSLSSSTSSVLVTFSLIGCSGRTAAELLI